MVGAAPNRLYSASYVSLFETCSVCVMSWLSPAASAVADVATALMSTAPVCASETMYGALIDDAVYMGVPPYDAMAAPVRMSTTTNEAW